MDLEEYDFDVPDSPRPRRRRLLLAVVALLIVVVLLLTILLGAGQSLHPAPPVPRDLV